MRLRRKPWARPELEACAFYVLDPAANLGKWHTLFPREAPLHIELGCGKGGFIAQKAAETPEINYLAIDIKSEVLALAKRKIEAAFAEKGKQPDSIFILSHDIERIDLMLAPQDAVERIYINFCNPWPKPRHKKKRLTHTRQLVKYRQFLIPGGEIWFKTDDDALFEESLAYFQEAGYAVRYLTRDFQHCDFPDRTTTEHEQMFMAQQIPIKFLIAYLPDETA